eukprot:CAMPEP_0195137112 /NCGR_PEP_ID=MMETSP0448-20130528/155386_1 /TAXON_ID=66468 /ORGANISM="Heterocapsa triquestra, Strain CCMP 448" /LENGTH=54 /DNA_ID=CAMNT_0040175325 /DNA_START=69 /DNA_END=230 /DNA_ORIENTATION=+
MPITLEERRNFGLHHRGALLSCIQEGIFNRGGHATAPSVALIAVGPRWQGRSGT